MGKSSPSAPAAPAAPDPAATAAAQTQSNKDTSLFNFTLNNPNVTSPLGSSTFTSHGTDANGSPVYNQNITLSPAEQALFDQNNQNLLQQGQVAGTTLQGVQNTMNTPYDLAGHVSPTPSQQDLMGNLNDTRNALYQQRTQYLDPQFSQQDQQLEAKLVNQGIPRGSQAWNNAMQMQNLQKQSAYSDAASNAISGGTAAQAQLAQTGLANQAQGAQMYTQQYQEPINLYSSLLSGTQPTLPQFSGANQASAAPTNVLGAYQNAYNGQLNSYNAQMGNYNSQNSGLMGLLGNGAIAAATYFSDRRLKKDIKLVGRLKNGIPTYEFKYLWDTVPHVGVLAQDVIKILPKAVKTHPSGYLMVNYSMLGG